MANKNDYSISLDGSTSSALITGYKVPTAAFSVCFWYKPTAVDASDRIMDQQDSGPNNGWTLNHNVANNANLQLSIKNVGSTVVSITSTDMVMNQWNFVTVTFETNETHFYVNGVQQGATDFVCTMSDSTNAISIGKRSGSSANFCTGKFTGLQIYNRPLSGSEVRKLYVDKGMLVGCVVRLRCDEGSGTTLNDTSGSGKNGALTSTTWSTDVPYKSTRNYPEGPRVHPDLRPATYLNFDGVNDYIDLGITDLLPDATQNVTIAGWMYRKGNGIRVIAGNQRDSTTSGWQFKISGDAVDKLEFTFRDQNGNSKGWIGNATIPQDRWFHGAMTYNGATCRFYIDGVEEEKETLSATFTIKLNASDNVQIGHRAAGGGSAEFYNGKLAKVIVFGRVLTNAEIQTLYLNDTYTSTSLLGYWKLDEGSGTTAIDSSTGGHNGTISGATYSTL